MSMLMSFEVIAVGVLVLAAAAVPFAAHLASVRRVALTAVAVAAISILLGVLTERGDVGVAGLTRLVTVGVALATLISAPRSALTARVASVLLLVEAGMLGVVDADGSAAFLVAWLLSLLPGFALLPAEGSSPTAAKVRTTYKLFVLGSTVPIALALGVLAILSDGTQGIAGFGHTAQGLATFWRGILFALIAASVLMRMAVAPFHGWLPVLMEDGPLGLAIVLSGVPLGVFTLVHVGIPVAGQTWPAMQTMLGALGLGSGIYGAIVALPQRDLRRLFAYLRISQAGLLLAGVAAGNPEGVSGALLYGGALGLTMTGVLLIVWAMQARTGSATLSSFAGSVSDTPSMAASFLILGFASIGFPGTLSFIAEDFLLHGILGVFAPAAVLFLLCTAINAITVMRVFQRTFLGQASRERWNRPRHRAADLLPRERGVAFALCLTAVVTGFVPGPLLALAEPTARTVARLCFG